MRGEVVQGMQPQDPPAVGRKKTATGPEQGINHPMMPIVWLRKPVNASGRTNQVLTYTMGAATDFENAGFRRLLVNGVYWSTGLPVPPSAAVGLIGEYKPSAFGFGGFRRGVKPADFVSGGQ
jgi:hypothetical protein